MIINSIYNENCLDTMSKMLDNFIDLTVTSPPYDNLRDYKGYEFDFESIAKELFRVTKAGGVVVWVVCDATINGSETGTSFKQVLYFKDIGFKLHDTMIWLKSNPMPVGNNQRRYASSFEYMFVFTKGRLKTFNPIIETSKRVGKISSATRQRNKDGSKSQKKTINNILENKISSNVWVFGSVNDSESAEHPAPFPEALVKDHIYTWSNEQDLIYDPLMGSGTTAKAAYILNRNWIGSEMSQEYLDIANERLKKYTNQLRLF